MEIDTSSSSRTFNSFNAISYVCECGYSTINKSNANKHLKTNKCSEKKLCKQKLSFKINDENVLSLVTDFVQPNINDDSMSLEKSLSGNSILSSCQSTNSLPTESDTEYKEYNAPGCAPGLIHYAYDKSHAKRALLGITPMGSQDEVYEHYNYVFKDPDIITIFTPNIKNIEAFVKNTMRKYNMMDREHIIHGPGCIRRFTECVLDYNVSLYAKKG